jgi:hypothetical protein
MTQKQTELINHLYNHPKIYSVAKQTNINHADDLVQLLALYVLEHTDDKLPDLDYFERWSNVFFRFTLTNYTYGKLFEREQSVDFTIFNDTFDDSNFTSNTIYKDVIDGYKKYEEQNQLDYSEEIVINDIYDTFEDFMVNIPEKVNYLIKQYLKLKNMSEVSRTTGVKYNTLRRIKRIIKKLNKNK